MTNERLEANRGVRDPEDTGGGGSDKRDYGQQRPGKHKKQPSASSLDEMGNEYQRNAQRERGGAIRSRQTNYKGPIDLNEFAGRDGIQRRDVPDYNGEGEFDLTS